MSSPLSPQDLKQIHNGIRDKYARVAVSPEGQFKYPTGRAGLEKLKYDAVIVAELPEAVAGSFCGVGNPFSLGKIAPGSRVLDIGCGAGVDALVASKAVGPSGKVMGIDITAEMIRRAEANKKEIGAENVVFQLDRVQDLAGIDASFDVVISNGALNLIPEKEEVVAAVFRLLKPGGWLFVADQFLVGPAAKDLKARIQSWFQWEGGAVPEMDFLAYLRSTGFVDVASGGETGFNSSPKTKGMLVRARKPALQNQKTAASSKTGDIQAPPDAEGASTKMSSKIDTLLQRAIALGAVKTKLIDTDSIVVEKWVKWKCIYGCPMFGKDGYHPPNTPDIDETKEVIGEYSKAILLNGADGRLLTEVACRLEGEAYHMGYYKAFAMIALPAGNGSTSGAASTWPSGSSRTPCEPPKTEESTVKVRPMLEACGIDVFKTARRNGFKIDTRKETHGQWNFFALVLIE